jgi:hypothetical protein
MSKSFHVNPNIFLPILTPSYPMGAMILTKWVLDKFRKLLCKFEISWLSSSWKEDFKGFFLICTYKQYQLSLVKIDSVFLEKSKMWKVFGHIWMTTDGRGGQMTENGRSDGRRTMGDQKSSLQLSAQVS